MDKIILDINQLLRWTKQDTTPIHFEGLPPRFLLVLNPILYLQFGGVEKIVWSPFQQEILRKLEISPHQIPASPYLCQLASGSPQGEVLVIGNSVKSLCLKTNSTLFQSSGKLTQEQIRLYLKRFGVEFNPHSTPPKPPFLTGLIRSKLTIFPKLLSHYHRCQVYFKVNLVMGGLCFLLGLGVISTSYELWKGYVELTHYQTFPLLTSEQQAQANLYRDYCQVTGAHRRITWSPYKNFIDKWRSKIVVTHLSYGEHELACHFVLHPDFQRESDLIGDWVERNSPEARLTTREGENAEFQIFFASV
jgi:hypothetical protein